MVLTPVSLGLILGWGGAFDTGAMPLAVRLPYWVSLLLIGTLVGRTVAVWIVARTALGQRRLAAILSVAAIAALVMIFVVWLLNAAILGMSLRLVRLGQLAPAVLIVTLGVTAVSYFTDRERIEGAARSPADLDLPIEPPKFLQRLPARLAGAELWAVQAEDHYLRLHTSAGEDLILMRLTDAIAELDGVEGARTHRSWWVARAAVRAVDRGEGRASLTLPSGVEAPVSRSYARNLREKGWF